MTDPGERRPRHLSSFHVELARLGEVSADERAWIEDHLRACASCAEMASSFEASRSERARMAGGRVPAALRARLERGRRWRLSWLGAGLLIPVAASAIAILSWQRATPPADVEADVGVKGGPGFSIVARRGARVFPVGRGESLRPGDQIRFVLERMRYPYLLIVSVDGVGRASIYVPYEGRASMEVKGGDRVEIPGSIVVDQSPGPERVFALLSRRPLEAEPVRSALAAIGARGAAEIRSVTRLNVGADEQASILVEKATEP